MKKYIVAAALLPLGAHAHAGHGGINPSSVLHWILEPLHLFGLVTAVVGVAALVAVKKKSNA